jgi:Ca2+-transporting ATPase
MALDSDLRPPITSPPRALGGPEAAADRNRIPISIVPLHTAVAGRARLRVAGLRGAPSVGNLLERGLSALDGVRESSASPLTGNIVVRYDGAASLECITERIAALLRGEVAPPADDSGQPDHWHGVDPDEITAGLRTCMREGLSSDEARDRLTSTGVNALPAMQQRSELSILLGQFQSLPVALLAGAAVVSVATGGLLDAAAILAVVALNGVIGFQTESRAERTIRSLSAPGPVTAHVVRDGCLTEVPAQTLVPGDLIILQRGMVVPADARLVGVNALTVSEAALTGESLPVVKSIAHLENDRVALGDRTNMVYRGTIITGGSGRAVVVATGPRTEVGRIQRLVDVTAAPQTPIQTQLGALGVQLVWVTLAASGVIFGVGWLRGLAVFQLVRSSLSVAVAAVPEGLPMVATTTLALGVEDLRRHGIFVRRLAAVETLAAVNVVCFDKTGTLTYGSMSAEVVAVGDRVCQLQDGVARDQHGAVARPDQDERLRRLFSLASLCSETEVEQRDGSRILTGSATENALVQAALDIGIDVEDLRSRFSRRSIQYRTEAYRFMATTHVHGNQLLVAVKGSPREVLARCVRELLPDGAQRALTRARRAEIERVNADLADHALRVLGIAFREGSKADANGDGRQVEAEDLVWTGLVGLADPVRPGLKALMEKLHRAGIQTIMLTGDQSATAQAVGEQIGLSANGAMEVIDSADLDRLTPAELGAAARRAHAFSRISPGQKLRIVRALQKAGALVAMVGDGINDSPALRAANIGIAVGRGGAAAAREVADVCFETDDLSTLLYAVERGRATYSNIRKAIHYIVGTNASEILLMLAGTAVGFREALSPIQLLWINLVSDVLPAIGLAMEAPEPDVMEHAPRRPDEPLVSIEHFGRLGAEAGAITVGALGAGLYGAMRHGLDSPQARTMTFGSLVTAQLLHALTCRSSTEGMLTSGRRGGNPALFGIVGASLAAQSAAFLFPGIRGLLGIAPIGPTDVLAMLAGGTLPFVLGELRKTGHAGAGDAALKFRRGRIPPGEQPEAIGGRRADLVRSSAPLTVRPRPAAGAADLTPELASSVALQREPRLRRPIR